jgi:hypothetical protein
MEIAELMGRGFGKVARMTARPGRPGVEKIEPGEHWLNEPTEQSLARVAATKVKTRGEQRRAKHRTRLACPHAIVRHRAAPHPRYGKAVPFFISWTEQLTDPHECPSGRFQ